MHVTQMWRRHFEKSEFFMQKSCARRNSIIIVDLLKMLKIVYIQVFIKSLLTNCLNSCCFQGKTMLLNTGLWKVGIHKRYFLLFQFKRIVRWDSWGNIFLQCKLVEITAVIRTLQFLMDIFGVFQKSLLNKCKCTEWSSAHPLGLVIILVFLYEKKTYCSQGTWAYLVHRTKICQFCRLFILYEYLQYVRHCSNSYNIAKWGRWDTCLCRILFYLWNRQYKISSIDKYYK